jgi:hypothetical protein
LKHDGYRLQIHVREAQRPGYHLQIQPCHPIGSTRRRRHRRHSRRGAKATSRRAIKSATAWRQLRAIAAQSTRRLKPKAPPRTKAHLNASCARKNYPHGPMCNFVLGSSLNRIESDALGFKAREQFAGHLDSDYL